VFKVTPAQWKALIAAAGGGPDTGAEVEEAKAEIAERAGRRGNRQGLRLSGDERRAIELHAMAAAIAHYLLTAGTWKMYLPTAPMTFDALGQPVKSCMLKSKEQCPTGRRFYLPQMKWRMLSTVSLPLRSSLWQTLSC
jgi:hypothetical protein